MKTVRKRRKSSREYKERAKEEKKTKTLRCEE